MIARKCFLKDLFTITKKSFVAWKNADPFRQSAVVAYYSIFSMPALLVIIVACAGLVFGQQAVQGEISNQISSVLGKDTALQIENIISKASEHQNSIWATIISFIQRLKKCSRTMCILMMCYMALLMIFAQIC